VEQRAALHRDGHIDVPSQYQEQTYRVTLRFIEEARAHLVLRGPIAVACPVRLLQGMADPDVPWPTAQRIAERLTVADVRITLIKDGDHRLSRDADLALLGQAVAELAAAPAHPPASARKPSR